MKPPKHRHRGFACRNPECPTPVPIRRDYCPDCRRVMDEQRAAVNKLLGTPTRQPYTPRVYTILSDN